HLHTYLLDFYTLLLTLSPRITLSIPPASLLNHFRRISIDNTVTLLLCQICFYFFIVADDVPFRILWRCTVSFLNDFGLPVVSYWVSGHGFCPATVVIIVDISHPLVVTLEMWKAAIKKMDMQASRKFLAELKVLTHVCHLNLQYRLQTSFGLYPHVYSRFESETDKIIGRGLVAELHHIQ
ncbi:hypothetical protein M8C21_033167, partial [Ambrosia artemisiifolia]